MMDIITIVCASCAAVLSLAAAALAAWPLVMAAWDRMGAARVRAVFCAAVAGAALFVGAKHDVGTITYPRTDPETWYMMDRGSGVSNEFVRLNFTRNVIVPASASFFLDGLELRYTNQSDWATHSFTAYSNTFANATIPLDVPYSAATNFNWICYTDWTPSPVVHTNGVAYVVWNVGRHTNELAVTRTGVYVDGTRLAPNPAITNGPPTELITTPLTTNGENEP